MRRICRRCANGVAGAVLGLALTLGGCAQDLLPPPDAPRRATDEELNVYPANYKTDILGAMHAYLNDPTGIRDAGIAEPALKSIGGNNRYVVCVRFNGKKSGNVYAGVKEIAGVFLAGKFDRFVDTGRAEQREQQQHNECAGAAYAPFPELQKLSR